jgi:electron transfer flavoprotein beta subunit
MRGIMSARTKPLVVTAPQGATPGSAAVSFTKPAGKSAVQMIDAQDLDTLVQKLHEEAKVI